jgi:CRP-like cAMP-binding protein
MVDTEVLSKLPLFESVDETGLRQIAAWFEPRSVSAGVELTGQGAPGYSFFVLADGAAAVTSGDATVAQLGPGDFFGEGAIVGAGRRSATVTTTAPSQVLVMFGTEFRRLQQAQPSVAAAIEAVARERLDAGSLH